MCKSIAEGGKRCRCADHEKQEKRRAAAAKRQAEYMRKKRAEHAAATAVTDPVDIVDAAPETSPETEHTEAVQRLTDYLTAIREQETAAHAEQVAAAMEAVSSVPNPFTGITVPEPTADPITVDDAYTAHLAREAAEERERAEQEQRDAAPKRRAQVTAPAEQARVEANFREFMEEMRAAQGVTST